MTGNLIYRHIVKLDGQNHELVLESKN
jgi:hypothetical protein